jgi:type III pantothenate kinase
MKSCPTEHFTKAMVPDNVQIVFASVVPKKNKIFPSRALKASPELNTGLNLNKADTSTLGADRLANAVAVATFEKLPAVCVDCGTALTFEIITADKTFLGGPIAPGRLMARKALSSFTAQLPFVPLSVRGAELNPGNNTISAIVRGTDDAVTGTVKEIISRIKKLLETEKISIIAIGGDAPFLKENIAGIEIRDNDYTLKGLGKIWEMNKIEN